MILRSLVGGAQQTISVDGRTMSYDELLGAAAASARGLGAGQRVAVVATPTMETVVGVVGALLAGAVVVPVPADAGPAEREHILRDSGAEQNGPVDVGARAPYRPVDVDPEQPALVLYTSGTTGPPKGVLLSHRAICAGLDGLADAWAWGAADVLAHGLPLFHVHGLVLGVLGPLRFGSGLVHVGRPTPDNYAGAALRGATMWFGVPTVWSRLADRPRAASALSGARLLVSGSAPLPVPVFERIRELTGLEVAERYGMSETLITVATRADGVRRAGWVGVPIAGVDARLRAEDGAAVPPDGDTVGRLEVRGATLFSGYLDRPEATAAAWTADGWFRTGDVAVMAADGALRIVGRESVDLIKSGGYRIGAGEVESVLLGHPAVDECAVLGEPDRDLGQRIVAYVVPRGPVAADELIALVADALSAHKRPREVRFVEALPRNEMGKVQKSRLGRPTGSPETPPQR
ncbi:MAG TPA: acyl-CoA synthetase [Marmoricola sp.]|nr:acyl-CoA synthetase [Marmoricola sp.]